MPKIRPPIMYPIKGDTFNLFANAPKIKGTRRYIKKLSITVVDISPMNMSIALTEEIVKRLTG